MKNEHELIIVIINSGFSDDVMNVARKLGVGGGTVINARGTAREDIELPFDLQIHPEKELVMMIVNKNMKDDIMHGLYKEIGLDSPGQGIIFAMPVDEVAGLNAPKVETNQA